MTVMAIIAMEYDMEPRTLGFSELNTIPSRNIAFYLLSRLRNAPSQTLHHSTCPLLRTITVGSDSEFKQAFRVSRAVFSALLSELAPYLRDGYSRNGSQNLSAELKLGVAMFFFAHGGSGQHLKMASGLSASTARKYIFLVADLICKKLASKFMGDAILNADDAYIEKCRTRFHARHGFPKVAGCIDGTHIPYKPNNGEFEADYKLLINKGHMSAPNSPKLSLLSSSTASAGADACCCQHLCPLLDVQTATWRANETALLRGNRRLSVTRRFEGWL